MKRREFVERAGIGAAALALGATQGGHASAAHEEQVSHNAISGPLATATVSFGAWAKGTNRRPNLVASAGLTNNAHVVTPNHVTIKAGGTVNYMIAGFHVIAVYDDGTQPGSINTNTTVTPFGAAMPPIIDDENNRVYRGIDPTVMPFLQGPMQKGPVGPAFQPLLQDRIEVVQFPDPGTFLVICAVLPHFAMGMYGYV
jgi:plastocyanin